MLFILKLLVDIYLYVLLLRLLLQFYKAPLSNRISQFVVKITDPVIKPLQRLIPSYRGIDLAIVVFMLLLQGLFYFLVILIKAKIMSNIFGILLMSIAMLADKWFTLVFWAIIIEVITTWVPALQTSVLAPIVRLLAEPWLQFARRYVPTFAGLDFSPLVVLLLLQLISIFVFSPVINMGLKIAVH